jgi:hypothetical protein
MAETERKTSFAKSVDGLHQEESALDRARALRDQFARAQEQDNHKQQVKETERPQGEADKSGSRMIREDAPALRPSPSGPMRGAVDRQAAYGKVAQERRVEDQKHKAAEIAQQFNARQQKSHDHERDRDR